MMDATKHPPTMQPMSFCALQAPPSIQEGLSLSVSLSKPFMLQVVKIYALIDDCIIVS